MNLSLNNKQKREKYQEAGYDDFCEACQIPYLNECPECAKLPDTNPGDMPSSPVDAEALDRLNKQVDQLLESETDETLRSWADSQPVHSAPSKEGASQSVDEMAATAREGKDLHYGGYREVAQALQSQLSSMKAEIEEKQGIINSRYARFNEFIEAANHAREGQEKALKLLDQALKERDVAIEPSRTWEKKTNALAAILEGKNLENAVMREALHCAINIVDLWGASQHGTVSADHEGEMHALLEMESKIREGLESHRTKYKKEEQK